MRIEDVRITLISVPWVEPPAFLAGFDWQRQFLVLEVETDEGITGMGFLQPITGGVRTVAACLREQIIPRVLGRDATHIEALWKELYVSNHMLGRMGIVLFAIAALDMALWDALGKKAGLPLYRLWGAFRDAVPVYGSGCYRGLGGDGMVAKARRYVAQGFKAIKMQVAHLHTLQQDVAHVRQMRDALGPDIEIMIDVNQGWTADEAIRAGRHFEELDIAWLEEPVPVDDVKGYQRVARALRLPIAGGENHYTRWDIQPLVEAQAVSILQPDVMRGGLTELRKIAAMVEPWGIRIAPHLFPELMVHLLCAIPNGLILEYMGWMDDLLVNPPLPQDGVLRPPETPGHGLRFKPDVLAEHRLAETA